MAWITKRRLAWTLVIVAGLITGSMAVQGMFSQRPPSNLGLVDGKLRACPDGSRNCVCSEAHERARHIAPFKLKVPADQALPAIVDVIESMPRTRVTQHNPNYVQAEFTSRIFRFVDDLELRLDADAGLVHVRSASRVGKGDLGVNRERVEALQRALVTKGIVTS